VAQRRLVVRLWARIDDAVPGIPVSIKWGRPVWTAIGPIASVTCGAGPMRVGFWRGAELVARGFSGLVGGAMHARHLVIADEAALARAPIERLVIAAVDLDTAYDLISASWGRGRRG